VTRILPIMLEGARLLGARRPGLQSLVTLAPALDRGSVERVVRDSGAAPVVLHTGDFPEILGACDAGVVKAGTSSLEAAMVGLPMVVVYRMNPASYLLGKMLVRVDHVALPNLVAGRRVVPELIQGACSPETIESAVRRYFEVPEEAARVREALSGIRARLGGEDAYDRAAKAVLEELDVGAVGR
jgi:lipid-A-disaccharide synthase